MAKVDSTLMEQEMVDVPLEVVQGRKYGAEYDTPTGDDLHSPEGGMTPDAGMQEEPKDDFV